MFSKQKSEKKLNQVLTVIGEETVIEGRIVIDSSIRIDGKVFGEIKCAGDVTIGKNGYVEKSVSSRNLFIAGTFKGNAKVESKIHIYDTGILDGVAEMQTIIIDEQGQFNGKSFMKGISSSHKPKVIEMDKEKVRSKVIDTGKEQMKDNGKELFQERGNIKESENGKQYQENSV
ncbi:bactofilin family protein [Evansella tamaricis]|uniref:Polymer-forming cytoskeletal protein n=1 Tax=Evansella tamaricis TaxID=2069301 RepID=A0ABS6J8X4_9BACI|nr:polymer-forming cytoskeletal protein [Evansella tamaricis]MBU9710151.1 polymer-forming cytoskeletal protein [Evansella tamaricis]